VRIAHMLPAAVEIALEVSTILQGYAMDGV
jgi:hypothetical protein